MGFGVLEVRVRVWVLSVQGFGGFQDSGLVFAVWSLGFRVQGLRFRVQVLGFKVWGLGFKVEGLGVWGCRVEG